jgi:opine dehydrogenase
MQKLKIGVLGAGSGGQTFAAHLRQKGHEIRLWNRSKDKLDLIKKNDGIKLLGRVEAFEYPDLMSTKISEVINDAEIILIVLPANAHKEVARLLAPYVTEDQLIILNPGRTAGALEFCNTLKNEGVKSLPIIAETQSLIYTCRTIKPGLINLLAIKNNLQIGVMPFWEGKNILKMLKTIYNNPVIEDSTLKISLENIGSMLHPTSVLLNTGWIESRKEPIPHYYHAISKRIAKVIEKMDFERVLIASKYGYKIKTLIEWQEYAYEIIGDNLYETLQSNRAYASINSPQTLQHRYIYEDIPTGLVPLCELGKCVGADTHIMDNIISLADLIMEEDFKEIGRNSKTLGIKNLTTEEIKKVFQGYAHYKR